jgi:hypothetical protein
LILLVLKLGTRRKEKSIRSFLQFHLLKYHLVNRDLCSLQQKRRTWKQRRKRKEIYDNVIRCTSSGVWKSPYHTEIQPHS